MESYVCITGATGGLGKAFAAECAERGYDLFLTDLSERTLAVLASGLTAAYDVKVIYQSCDLTDFQQRTELFSFISKEDLKFLALINVAGLDYEGLFTERKQEEIRKMLRLNIEANLDMTFGVLKLRDMNKTFRVIEALQLSSCL